MASWLYTQPTLHLQLNSKSGDFVSLFFCFFFIGGGFFFSKDQLPHRLLKKNSTAIHDITYHNTYQINKSPQKYLQLILVLLKTFRMLVIKSLPLTLRFKRINIDNWQFSTYGFHFKEQVTALKTLKPDFGSTFLNSVGRLNYFGSQSKIKLQNSGSF